MGQFSFCRIGSVFLFPLVLAFIYDLGYSYNTLSYINTKIKYIVDESTSGILHGWFMQKR
jgi:hypothetical protein